MIENAFVRLDFIEANNNNNNNNNVTIIIVMKLLLSEKKVFHYNLDHTSMLDLRDG